MTITPVRVQTVGIMTAALRWLTDQIIQAQPGAYPVQQPDGSVSWLSPLGCGKSPRVLDTGPGRSSTSQLVEVRTPDGGIRRYEVAVMIRNISERTGHEHGGAEDHGPSPVDLQVTEAVPQFPHPGPGPQDQAEEP